MPTDEKMSIEERRKYMKLVARHEIKGKRNFQKINKNYNKKYFTIFKDQRHR